MTITTYIEAQPRILTETWRHASADLAAWRPGAFDAIALVGAGSSFNALASARVLFDSIGVPTYLLGPTAFTEFARCKPQTCPLVIILSQSGRSAASVEAARLAARIGWRTLAVTADASSPIAAATPEKILLTIGDEPIGPKTKGYTASVLAVAAIAERLREAPTPFAIEESALADYVAKSREDARALAAALDGVDYIVVSGSGCFLGSALEGSLKIAEIAGVPTAAFDTEELLHGRLHGLTAHSLAIMIAADEDDLRLAQNTAAVMAQRGAGVRIANLTADATRFDWFRRTPRSRLLSVVESVIAFQWLAVELALRRGIDPHAMKYPGLSQALAIKLPTAAS